MHTNTIQSERRRNRSTETQVAMTYQLAHVREKFGFHAVVLADLDGFFFAGSTVEGEAEAVAAYSAAIADADEARRERLISKLKSSQFPGHPELEVYVHEFGLADYLSYLTIIAEPSDAFEAATAHAIQGVRRIFATT